MRIKTVLLSGVVAALSSASVMAQVYSLNAVGYINVTLTPGFSILANQLNTTNNNLSPLLDAQIIAEQNPVTGLGGLNSCILYKYESGNFVILSPDAFNTPPWDQTYATNTTLNPGEAVFVNNESGSNVVVTFVGVVLEGSLTNTALANAGQGGIGLNLISSIVPQAGRVDADLGLPEVDGDIVYVFNPSTNAHPGYQTYTGDEFNSPPWDAPGGQPGNPTVGVGQGFFYHAFETGSTIGNAANGGATYTTGGYPTLWVRNFTVN